MRGIHTRIVTALGGSPVFFSGVHASQTATLLAGELDERTRLPVVVIDEAHLLTNTAVSLTMKAPPESSGGAFPDPDIVTGDDAALVK